MPATIVSALLLIPVSIALAFVLPGVKFIPLGDLTNLMVPMAIICAATKGNIIHSFLIGIPIVIGNLYLGTALSPLYSEMAISMNYNIAEGNLFTSFLDGGHLFRGWIAELFMGNLLAYIFIPIVLFFILFAWYDSRKKRI